MRARRVPGLNRKIEPAGPPFCRVPPYPPNQSVSVASNPPIKMAAKMSKYEKLLAQTQSLQVKMEALQERVREAEAKEEARRERAQMAEARAAAKRARAEAKEAARLERVRAAEARAAALQAEMVEELKRVVQRYQRRGVRSDFRVIKGPFAPLERAREVLAAGGLNQAEIVVDAPAAAAETPRPPKSAWQKWCFDHVRPLWLRCEMHWETNLFSVARKMRDANPERFTALACGEAGAEPLQQVEVQTAVDQLLIHTAARRAAEV